MKKFDIENIDTTVYPSTYLENLRSCGSEVTVQDASVLPIRILRNEFLNAMQENTEIVNNTTNNCIDINSTLANINTNTNANTNTCAMGTPLIYCYTTDAFEIDPSETVEFTCIETHSDNGSFSVCDNKLIIKRPGVYDVNFLIRAVGTSAAVALFYGCTEVPGSRFSNGFFDTDIAGRCIFKITRSEVGLPLALQSVTNGCITINNGQNGGVSAFLVVQKVSN